MQYTRCIQCHLFLGYHFYCIYISFMLLLCISKLVSFHSRNSIYFFAWLFPCREMDQKLETGVLWEMISLELISL